MLLIRTMLILVLRFNSYEIAIPAQAAEDRPFAHLDDEALVRLVRGQGSVQAIEELVARGGPAHRKMLADIAEHFVSDRPARLRRPKGWEDERLERMIRNTVRVRLAQMGEEKYFHQFVVELSTTNLAAKIAALEGLRKIRNRAAIQYLVPHLGDNTIPPVPSDVDVLPVGVSVAGTINVILGPDDSIPSHPPERFVAYWKEWWKLNMTAYQGMKFRDGWPNKK